MPIHDFGDKTTKKNPWIRSIRKSFDVEEISNLLKKRFEFPATTGPYLKDKENASDIVAEMMEYSEEYRNKITPALGLLIYKINEKVIKAPYNEILSNVFYVIQDAKVRACCALVFQWLNDNVHILTSDNAVSRKLYKAGLLALAVIQDKTKDNEFLWQQMWEDKDSYWWGTAFQGLRRQNPKSAAKELPRAVMRGEDFLYLVQNFWIYEISRPYIEDAIISGFANKEKWAGIALNAILDKLNEENTNLLLSSIQRKFAA